MKIRRSLKYLWQRLNRGWDDSETWDLSVTIAKFTLPRLKRFKEVNMGYPTDLEPEEWDSVLDDMIYAMEVAIDEDAESKSSIDWARVYKGNALFGQYFRDLWW